jgi:hypothetical protein
MSLSVVAIDALDQDVWEGDLTKIARSPRTIQRRWSHEVAIAAMQLAGAMP